LEADGGRVSDYRVHVDAKRFEALLEQLSGAEGKRAFARAVNRAASSTRTQSSKDVRKAVNLKAADVKKGITLRRMAAREGFNGEASVTFTGRATSLYYFAPKDRKVKTARGIRMGVSVNVKGKRKLVQGAFVMTKGGITRGIFKRQGDGRYPLKKLFSTGILDVLRNDGMLDGLGVFASQRFWIEFDRDLRYRLSKV
jgi:hypothetical protein